MVEKVNLCAAAASIITGASRYFALRSSLDSRGPRFEDAGLRSNGGGKLVQRGDRRTEDSRCCGKVRGTPTAVGGSARFGHAIGSRLSGLPSLAFLVSIHVTGGTSRIQDLASARAATRLGWLRAELRARCAYPRPRGADPERTPICIWVSSTGFRQPGLLCAFRRRLVTVHVSPVSPSLTKEGNAACARQVCRKVTTRETRDQRRISTWYQNLRVLSAQSSGRSPEG